MGTASGRRRRKHHAISSSSEDFYKYVGKSDYKSAAKLLFGTTLRVGGTDGIIKAFDDANSFIKRSKLEGDL